MEHNIRYDQRYDTVLIVKQLGSYSAAGKALALTPSAVAQQIHSVEQELDATLFTREANKLLPTSICELISGYVSQVHMLFRRMDDDLSTTQQKPVHLVIGATPSIEVSALSIVLAQYQEQDAAGTQITIRSECAGELCSLLESGAIDIAVTEGDFPHDKFHSILLDTDYLAVVVPTDSTYAQVGYITLEQLKRENLILRPNNSSTRALFEANLGKMNLSTEDFHVMMEVENVDTIQKLVAKKYGISILSHKACEAAVECGRISAVQLYNVNMVRKIHILYRPDFRQDALLCKIQNLYTDTRSKIV